MASLNTWWLRCRDTEHNNKVIVLQVTPDNIMEPFSANGQVYRTVLVADRTGFNGYITPSSASDTLFYREEGGVVFRYDEQKGREIKMYDFNLNINDIVEDGDGNRLRVEAITDAAATGANIHLYQNLHAYHMQYVDSPEKKDVWIERYGSLSFGILRPSDLIEKDECHVVFVKGAFRPSITFPLNYDAYKTMPFEKVETEIPQDDIGLDDRWWKGEINYSFIKDTLHVQGRATMHPDPYDIIECQAGQDSIHVRLIEIYKIGPESSNECMCDFDVRIPGFRQGTYIVKTKFPGIFGVQDTFVTCSSDMPYPADVNSDNTIDISDIVAVINVIAGTAVNSKADVNADGKTDISDIVAIINIIANPLTEEQPPVFELHKTLNAGMLTPLCLPVDCSTENFDEVFSIMSIDEEGNAWICPTESIPAGTPFVARCNSKREVTPFYDVSVCDKPQQTELPWAGGTVNGDFGSFSWTYTTVLDSVKTPDILTYHECDLTDMTFNVSLENLDVRRYLAQIHYDYSTVSIIEDFTFNTTMRRDIPNPVTILLPENDASELLLSIGTTEGGNDAGDFKPQAGESAYKVYNLIPQRTYYYSLTGDGQQLAKGQFRTTGQLRMIHAPSVSNIRDLGGWPTDDGRHVRYGKLLRGGELNGQHQATPEDVDVLKSLGVAAEIDLRWTRKSSERFKDISAFGFSAEEGNYFFADAEDYAGKQFGETDTQERLKKELQLVINTLKKQKAVYFHCVWGADRTGFLAFLIEGILGLTPDSFFKEFELTSFSDAGIRTKNGFADRPRFFDQFDGETLSERCIHYCTDILGISQQDIDFLKETMLE